MNNEKQVCYLWLKCNDFFPKLFIFYFSIDKINLINFCPVFDLVSLLNMSEHIKVKSVRNKNKYINQMINYIL